MRQDITPNIIQSIILNTQNMKLSDK
jgi:hypothetical protein